MKHFFFLTLLIAGIFSGCGKTADGNVTESNKSGISLNATEVNLSNTNSTK